MDRNEGIGRAATQQPLDVATIRVAELYKAINAAQSAFTMLRSTLTTEQRLDVVERLMILQAEALIAIVPVLTEHEGQIDANKDAVDQWTRPIGEPDDDPLAYQAVGDGEPPVDELV